jgi:hypothetical protein
VKKFSFVLCQLLLFSFVLALTSCTYFFPKQETQDLPVFDTVIDFTSVDAFPLFPECKNIPDRDKQKVCFQIKMAEHINRLLKTSPLKTKKAANDTLLVTLKVLQSGKTQFIKVTSKSKNKDYEKLLSSLLKKSENKLPILQPAIKRGMPVTTQFELPVIIQN